MAEEIKEEAPVEATNVQGSNEANIDLSVEEGKAAQPETGPTADSLGVTQEQFDKYFKDGTYNWEAHAKEAEFKASQKPEATEETPKAEGEEKAAEQAVENAGLDWDEMREKIVAEGDIGEADYEALAKIGVPEEIAREYVDSIYAKAKEHVDSITGMFGGPEALKALVDTLVSSGTYTEADRAILAEKLSDPREGRITANLLLQQAGQKPQTVRGNNQAQPSAGTAEGFQSQAEMVAAMRDPRYRKDPAYRSEVMEKVRNAAFSNNPRAHTGGL